MGCRVFGVVWVLGVCREVYGTIGVKRKGTPTWDNMYQLLVSIVPCFVPAHRIYHIMDINKVSSLYIYLRDKYGTDSVKLLRFWEVTVKKMVDYRNHRRFTFICIKARIIQLVVGSGTPSKHVKVITSSTKLKNNFFMKE